MNLPKLQPIKCAKGMKTRLRLACILCLSTAIFHTPRAASPRLPESGDVTARYATFDSVLRAFVVSNEVGAAVAAVSETGRVVHLRSFGHADFMKTKPLPVSARFRIASVTKPVTKAAVRALISEGLLAETTRVTDVLKAPPWPAPKDPRWGDITVGHLLDHRGGWNRETWGDPMFMQVRVRRETGVEHRKPDDVVRWMMGQMPLQFDPGAESHYSNFGYSVLGRMIESVTKKGYMEFVTDKIAKPCGISSWSLARNVEGVSTDEVWYDFGTERGTVFNIELMDAHGGIVSTASDLCRFMAKFWLTGEPRPTGSKGWAIFYGSLPGTTAIAAQRRDGRDFAVLLNKRSPKDTNPWFENLRKQLDAALDDFQ